MSRGPPCAAGTSPASPSP
uniref:Uncharacterized protein n=1 Tax=Arundo donax TaxID=35708 RepID=A0A0A9E2Q9_ARUDO